MGRPQIVIENPILNTPFAAPARHFRFDDDGITDEIVEGRRPSSYFMPIPKAKKKSGKLVFDEWTGDRANPPGSLLRTSEGPARSRHLGLPSQRRSAAAATLEHPPRRSSSSRHGGPEHQP